MCNKRGLQIPFERFYSGSDTVLAFNERGLQFPCKLLFSASDNDVSDHHRASDDWFVINCLAGA
jgi:hypothetical protein